MVAYRLYCMDGLGKIGRVETLETADDREAVRLAYELKLPCHYRGWERDRCIAVIPAHLEQDD